MNRAFLALTILASPLIAQDRGPNDGPYTGATGLTTWTPEPDRPFLRSYGAGFGLGLGVTYAADQAGAKHPWLWNLAAGVVAGLAHETVQRHRGRGHRERESMAFGAGVATPGLVYRIKW